MKSMDFAAGEFMGIFGGIRAPEKPTNHSTFEKEGTL
jgi:hypothetical protein